VARVAINGLGRIGRATLKVLSGIDEVGIAAVNDLVPVENLCYLLRYDSVYGRYDKPVAVEDGRLVVDGRAIQVYDRRDPGSLPWADLGVDLVFECTGALRHEADLAKHPAAGAHFVILSAPARTETVATIVPGASSRPVSGPIVSCASCTTNCIAPVMEVLHRRVGVERAVMTTVHAYTSSQQLVDGPSGDFRRGRAGAANMIPASTGAALAATRALPELAGRFDGVALRVPIPVGSIADITMVAARPTDAEEINRILREEAESDCYRGVLGVTDDPVVAADIVGDPRASIVDAAMTRVVDGTLVKVMSWYDNEWGFTHQMVREALNLLGLDAAVKTLH
jgi:glyceraldehyde 3-phosphate dehydrogenase (phosphorylating)